MEGGENSAEINTTKHVSVVKEKKMTENEKVMHSGRFVSASNTLNVSY